MPCQRKSKYKSSDVDLIGNGLIYVALNSEVNTCGAFSRPCSQKWSKETTHVVFGGIPSLLHIHHVHVKERPELHLHKADRRAPTLGTLQKELLIHANNRQDSRGTCAERKFRKKPSCSQEKLHGRRKAGGNDGTSGCVGASALWVQQNNAAKV